MCLTINTTMDLLRIQCRLWRAALRLKLHGKLNVIGSNVFSPLLSVPMLWHMEAVYDVTTDGFKLVLYMFDVQRLVAWALPALSVPVSIKRDSRRFLCIMFILFQCDIETCTQVTAHTQKAHTTFCEPIFFLLLTTMTHPWKVNTLNWPRITPPTAGPEQITKLYSTSSKHLGYSYVAIMIP